MREQEIIGLNLFFGANEAFMPVPTVLIPVTSCSMACLGSVQLFLEARDRIERSRKESLVQKWKPSEPTNETLKVQDCHFSWARHANTRLHFYKIRWWLLEGEGVRFAPLAQEFQPMWNLPMSELVPRVSVGLFLKSVVLYLDAWKLLFIFLETIVSIDAFRSFAFDCYAFWVSSF